ncbi:hypothetical protein JYU34_016428 [Plutella xylostella]|uniref:Cuticular protein n=1 Tax=Plutella xylostella TaxID=51655 RepID=A0ABQ7Q2M9_PLUXY|nr:larval cuticle protein III/IV [Plutella xylostella]KAG7299467.1 hypothetical protein JYU34_016428 [Plutella xylostella]
MRFSVKLSVDFQTGRHTHLTMKFLVLALCVAAASAASTFGARPWQQASARATVNTAAVASAQVVSAPVVAAKAAYNGGQDWEATVLRSESDVQPDGFNYVYETANGIAAEASGSLRKVDNIDTVAVQGSYKYTAPDGTPVQVTYVADENGYQPQSNLLPVAPAIPEAILRSLQYIAAHPQPVEAKKF